MSRVIRDAEITTITARSRLGNGVHWRKLNADAHLGYRKQSRSGVWLVRWRVRWHNKGEDENAIAGWPYRQERIGAADDGIPADGKDTLNYDHAERRARQIVATRRAEAEAKAKADAEVAKGPVITLRQAVEEYTAERDAREANARASHDQRYKLRRDAYRRLTRHLLKTHAGLADTPLAEVTAEELSEWRAGLNSNGSAQQRLVNDLRAALNRAASRYHRRLPADFAGTIRHSLKGSEPRGDPGREAIQILPDSDVRRVILAAKEIDEDDGWGGDLYRLILTLAATGARFSQIIRMTVADVQWDQLRLMVPVSRKGTGVKPAKQIAFRVGEDIIDALRPAIAGRRGPEPLLLRPKWKQTGVTEWKVVRREPWHASAEINRVWDAIRKRVGLPADVVAYSLRHSSIVRGLRSQLPVRLVAALHDTSVAMIERHYAAYIVSALDDLAAKAIVPLAPAPASGVVQFPRRAS
jgi:integrase